MSQFTTLRQLRAHFKTAHSQVQYILMYRTFAICLSMLAIVAQGGPVFAQAGPPGSSDGMPWQVGALFTGHWVIVAIAIAMLSKPSKRLDKPKKREGEIES